MQGSVNLVTEQNQLQSNLPGNYLYNIRSEKRQNEMSVSHRNQRDSCSSGDSMNVHHIIFVSFHQNDRFSDQSRGFQCTCNALCMLSYNTACNEIEGSPNLDKILCEGDSLYRDVINRLKAQLRFIHALLNLQELPDDFEIELGKFAVEKDPVVSGFLVDTQENSGLPTLHIALQSALSSTKSCLLTIGAVCSAVFKRNDLYMFFDSHSHGEHGLSSVDGRSILISFPSLDDLVGYMYAFYDSMRIDMSLQFNLLPVGIRKYNQTQDCVDQNLDTNEASDGIAESVTVESIAETLPKVSGNAEDKLQFPGKCHAESFAECFTKEAECFAEDFSLKAALFCKHFANNAFDLHKGFDDTFAIAFIDAPKTHSRTDDISCENEDVGLSDAESEVVDSNILKKRKKTHRIQ